MTILSKVLCVTGAAALSAPHHQGRGHRTKAFWRTGMAKPIVQTMSFMTPAALASSSSVEPSILDMINPFSSPSVQDLELKALYDTHQTELTVLMHDEDKMVSRFEQFMTERYGGLNCDEVTKACEPYTLDRDTNTEGANSGKQKLENFKVNVKDAYNRNKYSDGHVVHGITSLMDLSTEEFQGMLGYKAIDQDELMKLNKEAGVEILPIEDDESHESEGGKKDWRDDNVITPIKNQAACGSCWAFSAVEQVESAAILAGASDPKNPFIGAPEQLIDCEKKDFGCMGGLPIHAFTYLEKNALEENTDYPYIGKTHRKCLAKKDKGEFEVTKTQLVASGGKGEAKMRDYVLKTGPLSIGVHANKGWQTYKGGVFTYKECGSEKPNHAVQAVAVDTESDTPVWTIRNSWTTDWGEQGFIRLTYGQNTCNLAAMSYGVEVKKTSKAIQDKSLVV